MQRQSAKGRSAFPKSIEAYASEIKPALQQRRAELDEGWAKLDEGWNDFEGRRAAIGVRPRTDEEDIVKVNVGGSIISLSVSLLSEVGLFDDGNALGGLLEGIWEEGKDVPRDTAGRIVLDESGDCLKHIIQSMLNKGSPSAVATKKPGRAGCSALSPKHLRYMSYVLGTRQAIPTDTEHMTLRGGSTVLRPLELLPMSAVIRGWCPDKPGELNLIYRASRDGFDTKSFRSRCTKAIRDTLTLVRVHSDGAAGDSVVGGFSTVPWADIPFNSRAKCDEAFIFMLRDSTSADPNASAPVRWPLRDTCYHGLWAAPESGPCFGSKDMVTTFEEGGRCTIMTGKDRYSVNSPAFFALSGKPVVDIEVFGVCSEQHLPKIGLKPPGGAAFSRVTADDIRMFGEVIASSLSEERAALQHSFKEMRGAEARVAAASQALQTVYGPDLGANKEGFVVELNVRGTIMTTLRSTLRACRESALAARFDEDKWPVVETDCDEEGRRLIDCRPAVFSKVLDALRFRKRESWSLCKADRLAGVVAGGAAKVVLVKARDRACFEQFVDMYFPGCQSFITDLVTIDSSPAQGPPAQSYPEIYLGGSVDLDTTTSFGDYW